MGADKLGAGTSSPSIEVCVLGTEGLPPNSVVSVRAGGLRRQRPLSRCHEPFVFQSSAAVGRRVQVDVLIPYATSGPLPDMKPGEHKVHLLHQESGDRDRAIGSWKAETLESASIKVRIAEKTLGDGNCQPQGVTKAKKYMERHGLREKLTHALMALFKDLPDDPMPYLAEALCNEELCVEPSKVISLSPRLASTSSPRVSRALSCSVSESLHTLPLCVTQKAPSRFMDLGSGETGFYTYEMNKEGLLCVTGRKRQEPFLASFMDLGLVGPFVDMLIEEFQLLPKCDNKPVEVYGGATGIHRDLLMRDKMEAKRAKRFMLEAQRVLSDRLGGCNTAVGLFVPSGLLEAKLELFATEWLVSRFPLLELDPQSEGDQDEIASNLSSTIALDVFNRLDSSGTGMITENDMRTLIELESQDKGLPDTAEDLLKIHEVLFAEPCDEHGIPYEKFEAALKGNPSLQLMVQHVAFCGTVSGGGGSCQLAMMNGCAMPSLQLFTVPVGNRAPLIDGMFSKPVTRSEQDNWRGRIRAELSRANFPRGIRGLYVGISAMYYAVLLTGLTDRIVDHKSILDGLSNALEQADPEDHRMVSNLLLVHTLIAWVFDSRACFVFKRKWHIQGMEYVATWTLGLFTHQHGMVKRKIRKAWKVASSRLLSPVTTAVKLGTLGPRHLFADKMFEVPFVAWAMLPSYLLDIGSGEVGVYVYRGELATGIIRAEKGTKISGAFYDTWVAKGLVTDFASKLIGEFGLSDGGLSQFEVVAGGTTGIHRDMLLCDQQKRDEIFNFISEVEKEIEKKLGKHMTVRIFVPSGELEAQFELRSVEWLIGLTSIDIPTEGIQSWMVEEAFTDIAALEGQDCVGEVACEDAQARLQAKGVPEDTLTKVFQNRARRSVITFSEFETAVYNEATLQAMVRKHCFKGSISAGGGSSQLALCGAVRNSIVQLYSMPIGNRVPIVEKLFSTPVTWAERSDWVERIRGSLQSTDFPQGVCGMFVGISAMYHAAKKVGIADCIVTKQEVMLAFAEYLATMDSNDHRVVANLTLVKEIIGWVFADSGASFLFKRNWVSGEETYIAGWTLGWYVSQFEGDAGLRERSALYIQRIFRRGRQAALQKSDSHAISNKVQSSSC